MHATLHDRLIPTDDATWESLFPDHPDSPALYRLTEQSGMDGFTFKSLTIEENGQIILLLPLFVTSLDLKNLTSAPARKIIAALTPILFFLRPRILGIGFVEGEWSAVGISPTATPDQLSAAWQLAIPELNRIASAHRAGILLFLNFTQKTARLFPPDLFTNYSPISTYPCARVPLPFEGVEDYLATLSKNARRDLRRKTKDAGDIRIARTRNPAAYLDCIHDLYKKTAARAELSFGLHRRLFFDRICQDIPGAEYVLYFRNDHLIAMNLLVHRADCLIDKYFAMDDLLGREHNLYFASWLENIRFCIENKIPLYHAGPSAEAAKSRLGCNLLPSLTLFRHRNPIAHAMLSRLRRFLACRPEPHLSPAKIQTAWTQ